MRVKITGVPLYKRDLRNGQPELVCITNRYSLICADCFTYDETCISCRLAWYWSCLLNEVIEVGDDLRRIPEWMTVTDEQATMQYIPRQITDDQWRRIMGY
jgi:G:T-mismatch repair DNA endonuclease (very short patch repair protein)